MSRRLFFFSHSLHWPRPIPFHFDCFKLFEFSPLPSNKVHWLFTQFFLKFIYFRPGPSLRAYCVHLSWACCWTTMTWLPCVTPLPRRMRFKMILLRVYASFLCVVSISNLLFFSHLILRAYSFVASWGSFATVSCNRCCFRYFPFPRLFLMSRRLWWICTIKKFDTPFSSSKFVSWLW